MSTFYVQRTTDKQEDSFICARIQRLEQLLNCRPRLPDKVLYVSSIKGKVSLYLVVLGNMQCILFNVAIQEDRERLSY